MPTSARTRTSSAFWRGRLARRHVSARSSTTSCPRSPTRCWACSTPISCGRCRRCRSSSSGHRRRPTGIDRGGNAAELAAGGRFPCSFRTAYPVALWPIEVAATQLDPDRVVLSGKPAGAVGLLQITLRCQPPARFSTLKLDRLRFHLDGEGPTPFALYELLFNNTCAVWVRGRVANEGGAGGSRGDDPAARRCSGARRPGAS